MGKKEYKSLTSLRGLFIMLIVLFHANGVFIVNYPKWLMGIITDGQYYGNYFFFMLSGFVISNAYKNRIQDGQIDLPQYMWKRIKKLYPLYIITNVYILFIYTLQNGFIPSFNLKYGLQVALMMSRGWISNVVPYNFQLGL